MEQIGKSLIRNLCEKLLQLSKVNPRKFRETFL